MPRRGGKHKVLVKGAEEAMTAFKLEVARDLGLEERIGEDGSFENFSTVEVGKIGGEMVRRIQAAGEYAIAQRYKENAPRLMPEEVLPNPKSVRDVSNNGRMAPSIVGETSSIIHPGVMSSQTMHTSEDSPEMH